MGFFATVILSCCIFPTAFGVEVPSAWTPVRALSSKIQEYSKSGGYNNRASARREIPPQHKHFTFIDNGVIRVGVDAAFGGVIGYLAPSDNSVANVINEHDFGREVQLAFYAEPAFYNPPTAEYPKGACNKSKLGKYVYDKFGRHARPWAPIGAGDSDGNRATILSQSQSRTTLNITSRPKQWPCHNISCECTFEKRLSVGSVRSDGVRVDATLRTFRTDNFLPKSWPQEIPAVYSNGAYHRLVTYNGSAPYTEAAISEYNNQGEPSVRGRHPGPFPATEHWAAYVNDDGYGMGIVSLETDTFHGHYYGANANCSYVSPIKEMTLLAHGVYNFTFHLVLGDIAAIRSYAYKVAGRTT